MEPYVLLNGANDVRIALACPRAKHAARTLTPLILLFLFYLFIWFVVLLVTFQLLFAILITITNS